jgi:hypothetical protein
MCLIAVKQLALGRAIFFFCGPFFAAKSGPGDHILQQKVAPLATFPGQILHYSRMG